jgi:hypothetical protein
MLSNTQPTRSAQLALQSLPRQNPMRATQNDLREQDVVASDIAARGAQALDTRRNEVALENRQTAEGVREDLHAGDLAHQENIALANLAHRQDIHGANLAAEREDFNANMEVRETQFAEQVKQAKTAFLGAVFGAGVNLMTGWVEMDRAKRLDTLMERQLDREKENNDILMGLMGKATEATRTATKEQKKAYQPKKKPYASSRSK